MNSTWPSRSIRGPASRITPKALDDRKHVAAVAMRRTADLANAAAKAAIETAYAEAHLGVLRAQTEDEVDRIERDFSQAVLTFKGVIRAFGDA